MSFRFAGIVRWNDSSKNKKQQNINKRQTYIILFETEEKECAAGITSCISNLQIIKFLI